MQPLRQPLDEPGYADLVDHLGELARARRAQQPAHPRVALDARLGPVVRTLVTADHDREDAVLGAGLSAGNRRIETADPPRLPRLVEFARHVGGSGGVIDEYRAFLHAGEGAVGTERHLSQIVVVAHAGE